jgi:hypothetical protein
VSKSFRYRDRYAENKKRLTSDPTDVLERTCWSDSGSGRQPATSTETMLRLLVSQPVRKAHAHTPDSMPHKLRWTGSLTSNCKLKAVRQATPIPHVNACPTIGDVPHAAGDGMATGIDNAGRIVGRASHTLSTLALHAAYIDGKRCERFASNANLPAC